jgi:hypothetical protein
MKRRFPPLGKVKTPTGMLTKRSAAYEAENERVRVRPFQKVEINLGDLWIESA